MNKIGNNNIANYARQSHARSRTNIDKILVWLYHWGWTTEPVLQKLLGLKRRPASELCERGILQRVDPPTGFRPAYILGGSVVARALELYEQVSQKAIPYPWPARRIPFPSLGEHQESAQLIALDVIQPNFVLMTERELRQPSLLGRGSFRRACPDFLLAAADGFSEDMLWHEIELNGKYDEHLLYQLQQRDEALRMGQMTTITWWCRTVGIAKNLGATLKRPYLSPVLRRPDGKLVRDPNAPNWSTRALREITTINTICKHGYRDEFGTLVLLDLP